MFTLEALPASQGDALWLTWGDQDAPHHLLVDAGPPRNALRDALRARIAERLTATGGHLELLVVTHIDGDHVGGVLHLFADGPPCDIGDVWFNGYDHHPTDVLGVEQAERLSDLLVEHGLGWNAAFGAGPVAVPADPEAPLPHADLPGGLRLTVLGPTQQRLRELAPHWRAECEAAGLVPGIAPAAPAEQPADTLGGVRIRDVEGLAAAPFTPDDSLSNAASITLLAEHAGRGVLLTGDALAGDVVTALDRLEGERGGPVDIHALKVPHHGSRANVTTELVERVAASHHLFCSDGKVHGHPSPEAVARVVTASRQRVQLHFNHRSDLTAAWDRATLIRTHRYRPRYPVDETSGITLDLLA